MSAWPWCSSAASTSHSLASASGAASGRGSCCAAEDGSARRSRSIAPCSRAAPAPSASAEGAPGASTTCATIRSASDAASRATASDGSSPSGGRSAARAAPSLAVASTRTAWAACVPRAISRAPAGSVRSGRATADAVIKQPRAVDLGRLPRARPYAICSPLSSPSIRETDERARNPHGERNLHRAVVLWWRVYNPVWSGARRLL
jgi:hypothetical protein